MSIGNAEQVGLFRRSVSNEVSEGKPDPSFNHEVSLVKKAVEYEVKDGGPEILVVIRYHLPEARRADTTMRKPALPRMKDSVESERKES